MVAVSRDRTVLRRPIRVRPDLDGADLREEAVVDEAESMSEALPRSRSSSGSGPGQRSNRDQVGTTIPGVTAARTSSPNPM